MKFNKLVSIVSKTALLTALGTVSFSNSAKASGFKNITIGDRDSFGFNENDLSKYKGAYGYELETGGLADIDGDGMLGEGDVLPDLTGDGKLSTGSLDIFDNRIRKEKNNRLVTGEGFEDNGSRGSKFTDISLAKSYLNQVNGLNNKSEQIQKVINKRNEIEAIKEELLTGDLNARQTNRKNNRIEKLTTQINNQQEKFPSLSLLEMPVSQLESKKEALDLKISKLETDIEKLTKGQKQLKEGKVKIPQAKFKFDFFVKEEDVNKDNPFYFNLLFGDYDVKDARIKFKNRNGVFDGLLADDGQLSKQRNKKGEDGLIQSISAELNFDDIFTYNAERGGYDGYLKAQVIAKDEPYLAFDFAEISTDTSANSLKFAVTSPQAVPEPTTVLGLVAVGALSANSLNKRKKKS
ncbi:MAG: PEP-CTERM sorting domain-containing protein [Cyanobacteria bacterium P01_D01_bin.50]